EATSEKKAMGWYADGKISALVGTHTHVGTADARILLQGTAYLTDIGMVGARDSVIGLKKEEVIEHMKAEEDISLKVVIPEDGPAIINGVLIEIDPQTRRAIKIERVDLETEV
ncbi:MAG: YmdB family metallophosphoesterase, partial [Patescibacteria group bacterium]